MSFRVAGIGEVLWDRFPDEDRLGGAPANFAYHAGQLGADATIVSRVGTDPDGEKLVKELAAHGVSSSDLQWDKGHPTGIVNVTLTEGQPEYVIESPAAWDHLELTDELKKLASTLDAVCFGTLAQRNAESRKAIQDFVRLCPGRSVRIFDVNLRQSYFDCEVLEFGLRNGSVLKLNGDELKRIVELFGWSFSIEEAPAELLDLFPLELIAITHGAQGCILHTRDQAVHSKGPEIICIDAVGAGDAFSAALATGILRKMPLDQTADYANRVGGYVASQRGAMPLYPEETIRL